MAGTFTLRKVFGGRPHCFTRRATHTASSAANTSSFGNTAPDIDTAIAGMPCRAASRAAPTVPETSLDRPRLYSVLTPDTTRSGRGITMFLTAMLTTLAGVAVSPIAGSPFGSVKSSRKTVSDVMIECPFPVWLSAGPTMMGVPIAWSAWATAAIPGARTPSSLTTRMRYGGGCRNCCASVGANRHTANSRTRRMRSLCIGTLRFWDFVEDQPAPDLFHRHTLGFMGVWPVRLRRGRIVIEPWQGSAPQLLGAHGRNVDEQETAFDGRRLRTGRRRRVGLGSRVQNVVNFHGDSLPTNDD